MRRAALAVVLALAGCGGGDDKPAATTSTAAKTTKTEVVKAIAQPRGSFNPEAIYKARAPSVVTILALDGDSRNALGRQSSAVGSGFVVDSEGHIATNAHVVTNGGGKEVDRVYVAFADGNRLDAEVVGTDLFADIALLKIDPAKVSDEQLVGLPLGSTAGLTVGDPVAAIGTPFGEEQSLSVGVVSALDRDIESLTRFSIGNAVQTDAAINHGNSGGPLLDADGKVIGVNAQIRSTGGGGEGVGFAIPVETAKRSIEQLREKGRVDYAYIGITSTSLYPQLAKRLGVPVERGAVVDQVTSGSPARSAGIRGARDHTTFQGQLRVPIGSDVVVAIDGKPVNDSDDLSDIISTHEPGETIDVEVVRDGKRRTLQVRLGTRPTRGG